MVNRGRVGATFARGRAPVILALLVLGGGLLLRHDAVSRHASADSSQTMSSPGQTPAAFGRLPMSFEPNQGQSDSRVKFLARGNGYGLYLMPTEAVLALPVRSQNGLSQTAVEMTLQGANRNSDMAATEELPGHSNYFIGKDPSRWRRNIAQFARVVSREVYPGIDLAFYGKQGRLEYDFDVNPGADPGQIEIAFKGAKNLHIAGNGDLVLAVDGGELRFAAPQVYQKFATGIQSVSGSFVLRGKQSVGFEVGFYDRSRTLVIDPVFVFSTYLGGSGNESCGVIANATQAAPVAHCPAIAVDSASRAYVAGATTSSSSFPVPPAGTPPTLNGGADVFLVRFNNAGTALEYTTYLGGSGTEYPAGIGVDSGFNVYVAGTTDSADFPTTASAFQIAASAAGKHVFVSKFDSSGSANSYTTYLSGTGVDIASGLAVDSLGRAYVFGTTTSPDFPTTTGSLQSSPAALNQFFFSKVNPSLSGVNSLGYSTYIGGSSPANGTVTGGAVAVDSSFNVYLAGGTNFIDMPVVNAYQSTEQGGVDIWAGRLNAPANNTQQYAPSYETYVGGSGSDIGYGIATDGTNAFITGSTNSTGLANVIGTTPFQAALGGGTDAFVAKLGLPATTGTTQGSVPLSYFSYLGGSANDVGLEITADSTQNARLTGWTQSGNFPNGNPLPGVAGGGTDAFFARIVTTGTTSATTSSTSILGGSGADIGTSIAVDPSLNTYVAGETSSSNFVPAGVSGLSPNALAGPTDAFVSKLGANTSGLTFTCTGTGCPSSNPTVTPSPVNVGGQVTFKYSIYNTGDPVAGVVFTANIGPLTTFSSATASSGSCGGVSGGTVVCNLGTVNTSSSATAPAGTVTIVVTATNQVLQQSLSIGNSGTLSVAGNPFPPQTITGSAVVNDFTVGATPASATVTAGAQGDYVVKVTPTGAGFPAAVSLSCGSGLPSGASCVFTNNPIPNLSNGPQSRSLAITTTFRVTTPASLYRPGGTRYALWLPVFGSPIFGLSILGLPILGAGLIGAGISRKRRVLLGVFFAVLLAMTLLQLGCGSSKKNTSTTTGTPAGTYTVTVNATAGATRTTTVTLGVK
jgi:hypothetical protein